MRRTLLCMLIAGTSTAFAQTTAPFGIAQGTTITQLKAMGAVYQDKFKSWRLTTVPSPNAAFEYYTVKATETTGACKVNGIGITVTTDSRGTQVKSQFAKLKTALNGKYGPSTDFDFLHAKSIWSEDQYWMRSLTQSERSLSSYWDNESGSALPTGLIAISLVTGALSSTEGFINVSYEFTNYKTCKAEFDKSNSDGL